MLTFIKTYGALSLLLFATLVVAAPNEDDPASDEDGAPVVIGPDDGGAYRDADGSLHYKSRVFGTELCTRIDEPDPSVAFDPGATYVASCAGDED